MRREQRFTDGRTPLELIGMQTLALGMEACVQEQLKQLNDLKRELGHPMSSLVVDRQRHDHDDVIDIPVRRQPQIAAPAGRKPGAPPGERPRMQQTWRLHTAVMVAAGMEGKYAGFPGAKLVIQAIGLLRKRGLPVPNEAEVLQGLRRMKGAAGLMATIDPAPPEKIKPKRVLSAASRKRIGANSKRRWALAKKLGLDTSGHLPSREAIQRAENRSVRKGAKQAAPGTPAQAQRKQQSAKAVKKALEYLKQHKSPSTHSKTAKRGDSGAGAGTSVTIPAASAAASGQA